MSEGNRFWTRDYVTTRERGDIPGCVPAVDVFVEREISQVRVYNLSRWYLYHLALRKEGPWPEPLQPFKNRAVASKQSYYIS